MKCALNLRKISTMDIINSENSGLNKKVFFVALLIGIALYLLIIAGFGYYVSSIKPVEKPKVKFVEIKEKVKPKPKHKKRKKIVAKKRKHKKIKTQKPKKTSGKKVATTPKIPAATPILPETVNLSEKEITLPENEKDFGSFPEATAPLGKLTEYRPVLQGEFNPTFGTKLKKFDKTAFGTGVGRIVVYKPPPPKIRTKLPPPPKVKVKLWINPDGTVDRVEIVYPKALGDLKLKQIIENYVLSWKFNSISKNEKQWAITTIRFKQTK